MKSIKFVLLTGFTLCFLGLSNSSIASEKSNIPNGTITPLGKLSFGLRKDSIQIPLLKDAEKGNLQSVDVTFKTFPSKDFLLVVFQEIPSSPVKFSLADFSLEDENGFVGSCKGFIPIFDSTSIDSPKGFNVNDSIGYHYENFNKRKIFSSLLFVVNKSHNEMKLVYKNQTVGNIIELSKQEITQKSLYHKREDSNPDQSLILATATSFYDKNSFALFGAYPTNEKPISTSFLNFEQLEILQIRRFTDNLLLITISIKSNRSALYDTLILDQKYNAMISALDGTGYFSYGINFEFAAGKFGPKKSWRLCNYIKDRNNISLIHNTLSFKAGADLQVPFFPAYISCHLPQVSKNSFRINIPLIFKIPDDQCIGTFKFSKFPEISIENFNILSKTNPSNLAENYKNKLKVINKTGDIAFIKLKDVTTDSLAELRIIDNNDSCYFYLPNGKYIDFVRIGCSPPYIQSKGEGFELIAQPGEFIEASLTLQEIMNGNYNSDECSPSDFEDLE